MTDFGPVLSLFFRDPDGLEAEVCVANPRAEPGVYHPPGTPAEGYGPRRLSCSVEEETEEDVGEPVLEAFERPAGVSDEP